MNNSYNKLKALRGRRRFNFSIFLFILFNIASLPVESNAQKANVAFLTSNGVKGNPELSAAYDFLSTDKYFSPQKITFDELKKNDALLDSFEVVWIHRPDSSEFTNIEKEEAIISSLKKYVENGGGLFLTLDAFKYVKLLNLEDKNPETIRVEALDQGYGRKLGLHAFRSHPIFSGMNGGAYIWAPMKDQMNRQIGYFGESVPKGRVVAVDWAYITLKEKSKLILEYNYGKGKVLAVGAYAYYQPENQNKLHLNLFTENSIRYLSGDSLKETRRFWDYKPQEVNSFDSAFSKIELKDSESWEEQPQSLTLPKRLSLNNFWDVAGERILIMGYEDGGIDEIWTHPFMAFRDYEVGVKFAYKDSIYWFKDQRPLVETKPEAFSRLYKFPRAYIKEVITSDIENPAGVIHYEYQGVYPGKLIIKFKSNLRFMWPYSEKALRTMNYTWDDNLNAFIIKNEMDEFISILGTNKKTTRTLVGNFDDFKIETDSIIGIDSEKFQASGLMEIDLKMNDNLDIVLCGTDQGIKEAINEYSSAMNNPEEIYKGTSSYYQDFLSKQLSIESPDSNFNEGYKWALIGTDRFFVNTPTIGKSLVAGYSTTARGWNGGHEVNGRPGYAWYFGRDGQWSGFALLDYGDFEKVKSILKVYQKYQDLSGKIYHELTTSGAVHYDAADATPLYIILAGKYLRSSGDIEFIRQSWGNIKSAMDYCFSTDTNNDHLIENTLVGHGWVEGGSLYGSETTFYLAGSWAATLQEAAYIAQKLGYKKEAEYYLEESDKVKKIVNTDFWNEELNFFNYGKLPDGSYNPERTALPTVPMYFDVIEGRKSSASIKGIFV